MPEDAAWRRGIALGNFSLRLQLSHEENDKDESERAAASSIAPPRE